MSLRQLLRGPAIGGTLGGVASAGVTAAAGAIGAAIMNSAGHAGYIVAEAAKIGAVGGAAVGVALGARSGGLTALNDFSIFHYSENKKDSWESALAYLGGTAIGGLVGYGILNSTLVMELGQAAASLAVGGAVTMIPAGFVLSCISLPIIVSGILLAKEGQLVLGPHSGGLRV